MSSDAPQPAPRSSPSQPHLIVTIADGGYVIPALVLILSLLRQRVQADVHLLAVGFTPEQTALFTQFPHVRVFAADPANHRNPATRKAEALLTAEPYDYSTVSLFDADCIVTGDLTRYLAQTVPGLSARFKGPAEDAMVFRTRYAPDETPGGIPARLLAIWQRDVGERTAPAIANTVCGGNLTLAREHLPFARRWHTQMMRVLPDRPTAQAHDFQNLAYFQLDESVLNSLLAFADAPPPLSRGRLDFDPAACLIHLGPCNPRYWTFWRRDRLRFYPVVLELLAWARQQGHQLPPLPWSLRASCRPLVFFVAYAYEAWLITKRILKTGLRALRWRPRFRDPSRKT